MTDQIDTTKNGHPGDEKFLTDHDYDGIKELNNPSPYWVLLLFLATIGFSLFYAVHYFGYPGNEKDQDSEYRLQMAQANKLKGGPGEAGAAVAINLEDKDLLAQGAKLYAEKGCIACHGAKGEGNAIGPNLTDNYWIHGCKPAELVRVISEGVPDKGMTPFKSTMTDAQIRSVTAYILGSLKGSNPANAKAPQGSECK